MTGATCPGCGAFFSVLEGPTHRYMEAAAGCWELFSALNSGCEPDVELLFHSRIPEGPTYSEPPPRSLLQPLLVDAYAVQHHGERSVQAVQSVALHLLTLHGVLARGVEISNAMWVRRRAGRRKDLFHKLEPPPLGSALSIRHLYPGGGVQTPHELSDYVSSVYKVWLATHRLIVEEWYDRFVLDESPGSEA